MRTRLALSLRSFAAQVRAIVSGFWLRRGVCRAKAWGSDGAARSSVVNSTYRPSPLRRPPRNTPASRPQLTTSICACEWAPFRCRGIRETGRVWWRAMACEGARVGASANARSRTCGLAHLPRRRALSPSPHRLPPSPLPPRQPLLPTPAPSPPPPAPALAAPPPPGRRRTRPAPSPRHPPPTPSPRARRGAACGSACSFERERERERCDAVLETRGFPFVDVFLTSPIFLCAPPNTPLPHTHTPRHHPLPLFLHGKPPNADATDSLFVLFQN